MSIAMFLVFSDIYVLHVKVGLIENGYFRCNIVLEN